MNQALGGGQQDNNGAWRSLHPESALVRLKLSRHRPAQFFCIDSHPFNSHVFIAGGSDGFTHTFDMRLLHPRHPSVSFFSRRDPYRQFYTPNGEQEVSKTEKD